MTANFSERSLGRFNFFQKSNYESDAMKILAMLRLGLALLFSPRPPTPADMALHPRTGGGEGLVPAFRPRTGRDNNRGDKRGQKTAIFRAVLGRDS